jgi:integrase
MGKRGRSEGTIYQDKHDQWWAQLPPGPDGKRPRRKAASQKEAVKLLRQMQAERQAGRDLSRRAETVEDVMNDWLESVSPHIRINTKYHYRLCCQHINSRIGKIKAQDVTTETIQRLINQMSKDSVGVTSIRATLGRMHAAYERLIPERFDRNPVVWKRLHLRKHQPSKRTPISPHETGQLLLACDDEGSMGMLVRYAPALWLAALLGLRRGEILGLVWSNIDFETQTIHIKAQRTMRSTKLLSELKTGESERTLPIGPRLSKRLQEHQKSQAAEQEFRGDAWHNNNLVIASENGEPPSLDCINKNLKILNQKGFSKTHPHIFRHGVSTLIDELGFSEAIKKAILGHTITSVTGRYTHPRINALRAAIERLEEAIFASEEQSKETT